MGIVPLSLEILRRHIGLVGGLRGCRMLELGDQQMMAHGNIAEGSAAKIWFEAEGVHHTSIDINGALGALPLDLSKPIDQPAWNNAFDIVTDFGTAEHVGVPLSALYQCRASCHKFCRPGGLLLYMNPKTGHWPEHGYHYFTFEHYQKLALACGYDLVELSEHPTCGNFATGCQILAVLQKRVDAPFLTESQFTAICQGTVFSA